MKMQRKLAAALAALFIISNLFPVSMVKADQFSQETLPPSAESSVKKPSLEEETSPLESSEALGEEDSSPLESSEALSEEDSSPSDEPSPLESSEASDEEDSSPSDESSSSESSEPLGEEDSSPSDESSPLESSEAAEKEDSPSSGETFFQESTDMKKDNIASPSNASRLKLSSAEKNPHDIPVPDKAPMFSVSIELDPQGYCVRGTFTEFTSDIISIQPLYSLDGETYMACGREWDLTWLGTDDENRLNDLENQAFLRFNMEPLKSYLAGTIDVFCLKLRLTKENGITYETKEAAIERGNPQPLPEEITPLAKFAPSMSVSEGRFPPRYYGKYQLTVKENATPEEAAACLPDTLPIEIQLHKTNNIFAQCVIDCPVTWKPISFPQLTAGESVTIPDAAEEIIVPANTVLDTPLGRFILQEPLGLNQYYRTDEVRLVLNPVSEDESPKGVLIAENSGLHMAFNLKPTGATAIRAYTLSQGDTEWTELSNLALLESVNAQPSTVSSGHALVASLDLEPYKSYRKAEISGGNPTPFLVGLCIEGGVYDERQLILPWPSTYEIPLQLPEMGGSGGNQGNAGNGNKGDSTEEGQRPYLPQETPDLPSDSKNESGEQTSTPVQRPSSDSSNSSQTFRLSHSSEPEGPSPYASAPETLPAENLSQETLPLEEGNALPHDSETDIQAESTLSETEKAGYFFELEAQAAESLSQETLPLEEGATLPDKSETEIQPESAPSETAFSETGLTAVSAPSNQKETSDKHTKTVPLLLVTAAAAAIYAAISRQCPRFIQIILDVLRKFHFPKHS